MEDPQASKSVKKPQAGKSMEEPQAGKSVDNAQFCSLSTSTMTRFMLTCSGCKAPVARLDSLLDFPSRLVLDCGASAKGDQGHLVFISNGDSWNIHKVVDFRDELVALPLCLTIIVP